MAALCGHFVALKHRMLRFLECASLTGSSPENDMKDMKRHERTQDDTTDNFGGCLTEDHKPVNPFIMA